jgi:multidrug efflux pump subunit AcrA (membrane-fusion protein)
MIAKIDAQSLEDHIDDISDDIEKAEADVRKRQAEQEVDLQTLMQNIKIAEAEYGKARQDARAAEVRTDVERELLKLAEEESGARYRQLQADVAQKRITYGAEIKILGVTRERHVSHRERHAIDLKKFTIYSPMDGLAVSQQIWRSGELATVQQGDQVFPGMLFMKVVNPEKMQLEASINQAESGMYRISQKATMRLDAFPGLTLPGHIHAIGALATGGFRQQYFIRNVPVKLAFDVSNEKLIPDLSGSADVLLQSEENAKTVPLAAVFQESGKHFVFVKKGAAFERRAVTLGLQNSTHAAIVSGVEPGDELSIERPTAQPVQQAAL